MSQLPTSSPPACQGDRDPEPEVVTLRDGTAVTVRPIRPDDAPRLQALFGRLSPESIFYRFLAPRKRLPDEEARELANVDRQQRMAFVATHAGDAGEEVIAVARYAVVRATGGDVEAPAAEAAVVVEDRVQRRGLGSILLARLAAHARSQGIGYFVATIHQENDAIMRLVQRAGLPVGRQRAGGPWEIRVRLDQGPSGSTEDP